MFDGAGSLRRSPPAVSAGRLTRFLSAALLAVGLAAAPAGALRAQVPPPTTAASAPAVTVAPAPETAAAPLPRPLTAALSFDRSDATIGETIRLTVTLRNPTGAPISIAGLRAALSDALPEDIEIRGKDVEPPLTIAAGETKVVVYDVVAFAAGEVPVKDVVASAAAAGYPDGIEISFPDAVLRVKSVLTPDWKEKGLRDIVDVLRARTPDWVWVAGGGLALLLLIGAERVLAARRWYPKLDALQVSLVAEIEAEIAALERSEELAQSAVFYAGVQETVTHFMVDFAGLPRRERSSSVLARDLAGAQSYTAEQVSLAVEIAKRAETARFSGQPDDPANRRREIGRLRLLVESVAHKAQSPGPRNAKSLGAFGLAGAAAGLQFGSPWALLMFVPFLVYIWKAWRARGQGERFTLSSDEQAPALRSWRERLMGLPKILRLTAMALIITATARPMIGVQRLESFTPSTDTMIVEDRSGSMDEKMGNVTKLQAAADAISAYIDVQRQGTQNRVGMETFDDTPYVDVKLTIDYDALIAHLKEIHTGGSTAIGEAILTAVGHFAEVNIMDLDGESDARVVEVKRLLRERGLSQALAYAKNQPDLMERVLHPERAKVVVLFTDGESNSGINPVDAAKIAASLGVKVYTVGVGDQFDANTLKEVAQVTKAQFYKAGDAARMKEVLLEIGRLEKSPTKIVSSISVNDFTAFLALIAFILLGAEATLANTRLRSLQAMIFALALPAGPLPPVPADVSAPQQQTQQGDAAGTGRLTSVPAELREGNRLYAEGRFDEAVKKFAEGIARHPEAAELYFNMADAYLRMGEVDRAQAAYQKYLDLTPDAGRQSKALFNLGNSALMKKDAAGALELYKEALRRDPTNESAKWNIEFIKQKQQEQQQQKSSKDSKGQKKKQKPQKGQQKGKPQAGQDGKDKGGPSEKSQESKGDSQDPSKDPKGDKQKAADRLTDKLGEQQQKQDENAAKRISRSGNGVWGIGALPMAGLFGQGIVFSSPWVFAAVLAAVPILGILLWHGLRRNVRAAKALSPATAPRDAKSWWGLRRYLQKSALAGAILALVGLAATDPRGGAVDERMNFGGKDIIALVDDSYSVVYAEDARAAQAKKDLGRFIAKLQGTDRVGLVVFSGDARTASPISIDYGNFEYKVNRLELEARGLKEGSNLAEAVRFASQSFETVKKIGERPRILIVVSDGEVFDSEIDAAIKAAKEHNVTVYAIGLGSPEGTKMKIPSADGKSSDYLLDSKTGQPAQTHLVEEKLKRLADSTGGAYFRADKSGGIDRVMESVAKLERGHRSDAIKSPAPVGTYLLWPALALLLLDLLLPGRSFLRRDVPPKAEKKTKGKSAGTGMMGAALVPLAAWPQIFPFALIGAIVAALIAVDVWKGGFLTRYVRDSWQRRMKTVENGVLTDLPHLFSLRESELPRLTQFAETWSGADDRARRTMIFQAAEDPALRREKLIAAYLLGAETRTHEEILAALARDARAALEPLAPLVSRIAGRRADLAWLSHGDVRARLERLEELAGLPATAAPVPAAPLKTSAKAARGLSATLAVATVALSLLAGQQSYTYSQEQAKAEESAFRIFYGDDLYVFSDRYIDDRIPTYVLPAFRHWVKSSRDAGPEFERAMEILRSSPDPKADNLLLVAFRREALLPFTSEAEGTLLRALIERESDTLWESLDKIIAQSGDDQASAARLAKLVALGIESGSERTISNLFRVLKSPNKSLRHSTFEKLYASMTDEKRASKFLERLTAVNARFASDLALQQWTEVFALRRASSPEGASMDAAAMWAFLDQLLANAVAIDGARLAPYAFALEQAQKLGQEPQLPPSALAEIVGVFGQFAQMSQGEAASAPLPPMLAAAELHALGKAVNSLVSEGDKILPGLGERLVKDGVLSSQEAIVRRAPYYAAYGIYLGALPKAVVAKDFYRLRDLQALAKAVAELAEAAEATAGNNADKILVLAEFSDRATSMLKSAQDLSVRLGIPEGGAETDAIADQLQPLLRDGMTTFKNVEFLEMLRKHSLAPAVGDPASRIAYALSLDAAQIRALRGLLSEMAKTGKLPDVGRELTWAERAYVARAIDAVDVAANDHFPAEFPIGAGSGIDRIGEDALVLPRYVAAIDAARKNADELLRLESNLLAFLASDRGRIAGGDEIAIALRTILSGLNDAGRSAEGWAKISKAIDVGTLKLNQVPALKELLSTAATAAGENFKVAFGALARYEFVFAGLMTDEASWRGELKPSHYDDLLRAARLVAAQKRAAGGFTAAHEAALARIEAEMPKLKALALKLGIAAGDSPAEREEWATKRLNVLLHILYIKFPGVQFWEAAVAHGVAVKGSGYDQHVGWFAAYTPAQAQDMKKFLAEVLAAGEWRDPNGNATTLTDDETAYLKAAIHAVDELGGAPKASANPLHSFSFLGAGLLANSFGPWAVAAVVAAVATWLIWKYALRKTESVAAPREEASGRQAHIDLAARRMANSVAVGSFRSRFIGAGGSEIAEPRIYEPGDDVAKIDWKTTAKTGVHHTKRFELEKDMALILLIDVSRSALIAATGRDKRAVIAEAAEALALAAVRSNVRVGAILFADGVETVLPPRGGLAQAQQIASALESVESGAKESNIIPALDAVDSLTHSRAMVAVLSDFLLPDFADSIAALAARHDVRTIRVVDPSELQPLPDVGLLPVANVETGARRTLDTSSRTGLAEAAAAVARREARIDEALHSARSRPITLLTNENALDDLAANFDRR
jgi:tetratricopeptide (TPR) repeat protein